MDETGDPTDEALMAAYQQGEAAAFEALYDRYRDRVYGFLTRQVGDRDRGAELFQETFLRLHDSRRRYDPSRPFAPWLFRIARNLVADERRRAGRRGGEQPLEETTHRGAADGIVPHPGTDPVEQDQLQERLQAGLASLPPEQREAIALSYFGTLKYRQIAAVMGVTEDAVKQRVRRGLAALRERLGEPD